MFALKFQAGEIALFIPWRGCQPSVRRIQRAAAGRSVMASRAAPAASAIIPGYAPHVFSNIARGVSLFRKLVRENVELVNLRRFGKQITGLRFFH